MKVRGRTLLKKISKILGVNFSSERTSVLMDISLFVFFCSKTFLGNLVALEYVSFVCFILATMAHMIKFKRAWRPPLRMKRYFTWYVVFAIFACASVLWSLDAGFAVKMIPSVLALAIFCVAIVYYAEDKNQVHKLVVFYLLSNLLAALNILIFFAFTNGTPANRIGQITGVFSNTIVQTIAFSIVVSIYLATRIGKGRRYYLMAAVVLAIAVIISESRKAVLIPIIGVAIVFLLKKKTHREKKIYMYGFFAVVALIVVAILANVGFRTEMANLFSSTFLGADTGDWSIYLRNFFRETAIDLWRQHPVFGAGLNNFAYYVSTETWYNTARYAHNNFVELLSGLGIIGFVLYYWIYVYVISKLAGAIIRRKGDAVALAVALVVPLLIFDWGVVSYSGVMYNVLIFVSYYIVVNMDKVAYPDSASWDLEGKG